jgi:hypothetical protein
VTLSGGRHDHISPVRFIVAFGPADAQQRTISLGSVAPLMRSQAS